jgi:integrase
MLEIVPDFPITRLVVTPRKPFKGLLDPTEDKAAVLKPRQFKDLLLMAGQDLNGVRNTAIIWHSFGSALRVTEIAHLKVKDVLDRNGEVKEMGTLPGSYTKNGKARTFIQVEPEQREAIAAYVAYRREYKMRVSAKPNEYAGLQPSSPLYLARGTAGFALNKKRHEKVDGTVVEYEVCSSLQQLITRMIKRVGVVEGSSHSGRRTFATRLSERGVDDSLIQSLLGHGEPNMTIAYIEANMDLIKKARIYPGL